MNQRIVSREEDLADLSVYPNVNQCGCMFQDFSILTVRIAMLAVRTGGRAGLMTRSIGRVTQMLFRFSALALVQVTEHVCRKSCQNERPIACSSTKKLSCVSHRSVLHSCFMGCLASKDQCSPADKLWFASIACCAPCSLCISSLTPSLGSSDQILYLTLRGS